VPKQLEANGITADHLTITPAAIHRLVRPKEFESSNVSQSHVRLLYAASPPSTSPSRPPPSIDWCVQKDFEFSYSLACTAPICGITAEHLTITPAAIQ
jgi:hypothetical protein